MKMKIHSTVSDFSVEELIDAADANDTVSIIEVANEALDSAIVDDISECFDEIPMSKREYGLFPRSRINR